MGTFSPQTIEALALVITGGSATGNADPVPGKYRSAWHLEQFFKHIGVTFSVNNRSRVPAVRECLDGLNASDFEKIESAIRAVTDPRDYLDKSDDLMAVVNYMNRRLKYDGRELRLKGEFYRLVSIAPGGLAAAGLKAVIDLTDYDSVQSDFERSLQAANDDPEDAITAACSTVESVCKCILDEMKQPYPNKQDIRGLVSEVGKHLNLSPSRSDLPAELAADIKQVLSGLISVTSGIGALRTHGGDAHGRGRTKAPVDARIARLAIHAASTVSLFYIETWNRTKRNG
jgi:hypothetical protein